MTTKTMRKRKPGAGRKSPDGAVIETTFLIRLTEDQKAKLLSLGGASWIRKTISACSKTTIYDDQNKEEVSI